MNILSFPVYILRNSIFKWLIVLVFYSLSYGCVSYPSTEIYKLYPGPVRSNDSIAIVHLGKERSVYIDGMLVNRRDWASAHLVPGSHSITWQRMFMVSVLINSSGWDKREIHLDINLEAGHVYILKSDRTTGQGYRMYQWVEDLTSGELVAGMRKP